VFEGDFVSDIFLPMIAGFGIDDFAKEFAEFEVCIEVFCGDGEEGVFVRCGGGC